MLGEKTLRESIKSSLLSSTVQGVRNLSQLFIEEKYLYHLFDEDLRNSQKKVTTKYKSTAEF